ncbi:MFS transporter [Haloferax sp. DFSO52]|uniref:MFS transporter n=1 Tax=Haloferax sp. DFSO52 TaxID=3388505 RepID=UPI003A8500E8
MTIFLSSVLMMMNAQMMSPLLPVIMDQYSISESSIGLVMTALTLPPILFIPIVGPLTDRYPRRWVLAASVFLVGVAGLAIPYVGSFNQLLGLRVLQGLGYSGVMPTTVTLLGDLYGGSVETTAQGIRSFLNNLASAILPVVGGALVAVSWEAPFFLYLLNFPVALVVMWALPEIQSKGTQPSIKVYVQQIFESMQRRRVYVPLWIGFAMFFVQYGFITYAPLLFVRQFDVPASLTGAYVGAAFAGGAIGASQAGRVVDRFSKPRTLTVAFVVVGTALIALPFVGASRLVTFPLIAVYGIFWGLIAPTQRSMVNQAVDASIRAGVNAGSYTFQNTGKALAPILVGLLVVIDYSLGFALLGVVALVTSATILIVGFERAG